MYRRRGLSANGFHCAHAVLKHLGDTIPVTRELLDGTSGFIGGTVFKGLVCLSLLFYRYRRLGIPFFDTFEPWEPEKFSAE